MLVTLQLKVSEFEKISFKASHNALYKKFDINLGSILTTILKTVLKTILETILKSILISSLKTKKSSLKPTFFIIFLIFLC